MPIIYNDENKVRDSKEISRAELIFMIAKLRGELYAVRNGKKNKDWTVAEVTNTLEKTIFNISDEDNVDWNVFTKKYL